MTIRPATIRAAAVVLAGGSGTRAGAGDNKVLLPLAGSPVIEWSLRTLAKVKYVERVVVVARPQDRTRIAAPEVVEGGSTRHASEWNALGVLAPAIDDGALDVVAIHDAARPLAHADLWHRVIEAAHEFGGALPTREQKGLLRRDGGRPGPLVAVQTPQAFRARDLLAAYRLADADGFAGTDTAGCVERYTDLRIRCVPAPATNLKITFPEDIAVAEALLRAQ